MFDLFSALEANDEQLDFPTLFASGRQGWAADELEAEHKDMEPLFDLIAAHVPAPKPPSRPTPFRMLVHDARGRSVPRPHPDRPHPVRRDQAQHARSSR